MKVIYSNDLPYIGGDSAIFLVGPTPRKPEVPSWRPDAIAILKHIGFKGSVLVPEPEGGERWPNYDCQVDWEYSGLFNCDVIAAWVPRNMENMLALTTNVEFGYWVGSQKIIYGRPPYAPHTKYLDWLYNKTTGRSACDSLENLLLECVAKIEKKESVQPLFLHGE